MNSVMYALPIHGKENSLQIALKEMNIENMNQNYTKKYV